MLPCTRRVWELVSAEVTYRSFDLDNALSLQNSVTVFFHIVPHGGMEAVMSDCEIGFPSFPIDVNVLFFVAFS